MSIERLARQLEPKVLSALLAAFADVRDSVRLADIERLIAAGDYERVLDAVGLDQAAFRAFEAALTEAYGASGVDLAQRVPALVDARTSTRVVFRFDVRNVRAEKYLRENSATLVSRIVDDSREAIRVTLRAGLEVGLNPRSTALDIVGRIDPRSRRRTGGVIGLSKQQAEFVANMKRELRDPSKMANYFTRQMRDKRFDKTVARALQDGRPLDQNTIAKLSGRYSDNLLRLRGETIARTETLNALREARLESTRQLVDTGRVKRSQIAKVWDSTGDDGRTRDSHLAMDGVSVGVDDPFVMPDGSQLMYPGDSSLGAPVNETVNCRCVPKFKIDFLAGVL